MALNYKSTFGKPTKNVTKPGTGAKYPGGSAGAQRTLSSIRNAANTAKQVGKNYAAVNSARPSPTQLYQRAGVSAAEANAGHRALVARNAASRNTGTSGGRAVTTPGRAGGAVTPVVAPPVPPKPPVAPTPGTVTGPAKPGAPVMPFTKRGSGKAGGFGLQRGAGPRQALSMTPEMLMRIAAQRVVNRG